MRMGDVDSVRGTFGGLKASSAGAAEEADAGGS
ncbi:hypothetical protein SNOG_00675 [Parastagonospora nodorum SN15]|uniref:Uncharacterized protein n=1 Tax=Phaeosphaeria nodorum (strain SN15 / ATCC MYA-4574 / FGSC 10173) TaxID=321614 RepID=Q0V5N9_PHANO|nr:hypothetical protein SNOG_00675 [Parastagonospora nodorum SN15]EAT92170.1 hypothetical protein SNOG_00675 [Parastagonospora nodorum SN15]